MKITLREKILQSPVVDNGLNTFKDIDCVYIQKINTRLVKEHYQYFRSMFTEETMKFVINNPIRKENKENKVVNNSNDDELEAGIQQIKFMLLRGDKTLNRLCDELLLKVCFKDENFKNPLTIWDLEQLDYHDWEDIICNFLSAYWLKGWLDGKKAN